MPLLTASLTPIPPGAKKKLRAGGIEPVQYIYPNTYIVWGRKADRTGLSGKPSIRWTGDFAPAYRVQPQWRNLPGGTLAPGSPGDVTVLDLGRKRQVDPSRFESKGRNTPFGGWILKGWPVATVVGGKPAWDDLLS